jgi:hypothetical protein
MTATQPDLFAPPSKAPVVSSEDVGLLLNILRGAGWMKAAMIAADFRFVNYFGKLPKDAADRKIRAIAAASTGQIISYPGSPGYKITLDATIEEIQRATAKLRHQATEMTSRALQIDRIYHCKVRP